MGTIKSLFDDSTTLELIDSQKKPGDEMIQNTIDEILVTNEPKKIQNDEFLSQNLDDKNLSENKSKNSPVMQSASAATFQPPDFLQRNQYFRSFRSASRRFFSKNTKTLNESNVNVDEEDSSNKNIPNRNLFYRSFKNLNRNNCISNIKDSKESYIIASEIDSEMNTTWFKNLRSKSHADLNNKKKSNSKKITHIDEETPKFPIPNNKNLSSKSLSSNLNNLNFTAVEIDPIELKNENEKKSKNSSPSSSSSASSTGMYSSSQSSNPSINNSKSFDQLRQVIQIPIKIFTDHQSAKQQQENNLRNSIFLNELNKLNEKSKKNDAIIEELTSEVNILNRLLDVFDREDPKIINELVQKNEDFTKKVQDLQAEISEQFKIKNKYNQVNRFSNQVIIKLYEDCIVRLDKQNEALSNQLSELNSIKQFLVHIAAVYNNNNQHSSQASTSNYGFSDQYYSHHQPNSEAYYQNYPNYNSSGNFYYNPRSSHPHNSYYTNRNAAYIEQPTVFYYTYRTQPNPNLFFDPVTGQYFYRKQAAHVHHPHAHVHSHNHPHAHTHGQQFFHHQNGNHQFMKGHRNFPSNPSDIPTPESPTTQNGAIITEVSDDEDDFLRNKSDKKKDYVDAVSLNGDE
ncbi:unnamed protein product [Brachionus calyciflorus]|uniref:Uncharacterized protein n=1 Tax=Brachionus calyciflorus TaxID=104777 RepID=A0A813RBH3_9BILA|nr:unnamed protein product [Brachionus calyciflorus]